MDTNFCKWVRLQDLPQSALIKHLDSSKHQHLFMFFVYHQCVVPQLNTSIYHLTMKIISWQSHIPQCKKLKTINISSLEFGILQHLEDHWNKTQLHKLANIPTVPIAQLYKHLINNNGHIILFDLSYESVDDIASIWTLFSHTGIYIKATG